MDNFLGYLFDNKNSAFIFGVIFLGIAIYQYNHGGHYLASGIIAGLCFLFDYLSTKQEKERKRKEWEKEKEKEREEEKNGRL